MKRTIFDDRNPEKWTRADRKRTRPYDRLVISSRWTSNPAGIIKGVQVMPTVQPGILYWGGKPADSTGYNGKLATRLSLIPDWDKVAGAVLPIWASDDGRQQLWAFDVANLAVTDAWTDQLSEFFIWANGLHFDYYTSLGWIAPDRPLWAWNGWDSGYAHVSSGYMRAEIVIGQQFHITPLSPYCTGQFVEEYPTRSGKTLDYYREVASPEWCFEIRDPSAFPEAQLTEWLRFIEEIGAYVSWGRCETAGVGLDEAMAVAGISW